MAEIMGISEDQFRLLKSQAEKYHTEGFKARKEGKYKEAIHLYS